MKMNRILSIVLLSIVSISVMALEDQCTSWGCKSTISELYTNAQGDIYVATPLDEKLANCTAVSGVYFTLDPTLSNAKEVYSTLLAAFISNKKVQLRVKEGDSKCRLSYVRLDASF